MYADVIIEIPFHDVDTMNVVWHGHYLKYLNEDGSLNMNRVSLVKEVVDDALNGLRNNNYYSFRSNGSVSYSDNQIVYMGNRYR